MGFLSVLGSIAKVALPIAGSIIGGPVGGLIGGGLSKILSGVGQGSKAGQLEAQNVRPVDAPESELYQNVAEANANARTGMGANQYSNSQRDIQRNQNFGVRTAVSRGGGLAALTGLVSASNDATNSLNAQDDAIQRSNQNIAYQQRQQLAARKYKAFDWNSRQKFLENASAIRALKGSSAQNIWGGLGSALTGLSGAMSGDKTGSSGGGLDVSGITGIANKVFKSGSYSNQPVTDGSIY